MLLARSRRRRSARHSITTTSPSSSGTTATGGRSTSSAVGQRGSSHGATWSLARFNGLATALAKRLKVGDVVLDGEVICIDAEGRSQFNALSRRGAQPFFYAFDVLWLDGRDVRELTLRQRRALLQIVVPKRAAEICVAEQVVGRGVDLFREICRSDLEGMVAKPFASPYDLVRGRIPWVKVLNPDYTPKRGRAAAFKRRR